MGAHEVPAAEGGFFDSLLRRPRLVLTLLVVMVLAGFLTYVSIPKEADPDIDVPVFVVNVVHEGISPEDAVRLLVKPMETELRGLDGLKEITATASQGAGTIMLEFKSDVDHDEAASDVREKVDLVRSKLPADAKEPVVSEINFSLVPVIAVVLSGEVPERTLYQHARRLKDQIEAIPSVLEANLVGHREELLEVVIDRTRLESYNISQEQLIAAVTRNNQLIAAGFMDSGSDGGRFSVKVPGLFETADDVYSLPVIATKDGVVTLKDVADIRRTFKDRTSYSRLNGEPAIAIQVVKRLGSNIVENNQKVRETVAAFTKDWPEAIRVAFTLDQSKSVFEILSGLESSIINAVALVMLVILAALGARSSLLIGASIPASFMIGFMILGLSGQTLNMMHMFGLALTVGMLVDAAIVMVEFADRKTAEGLSRREAYILAAKRMAWPVFSSTATTLAAFLPMLLWPGISGEFMSFLPITVIYVLSASMLTALLFMPVLGGMFGRKTIPAHEIETAHKLSGRAHADIDSIGGFTGTYMRFLRACLRRPLTVIVVAVALMTAIFLAFGKLAKGVEFFVDTEPEQALVFVSGRGNLSTDEKLVLVREVENVVLQIGGLKAVYTTVGDISGGGQFDGGGQDQPLDLIGQINLELADLTQRRRGKVILEEIRTRTAAIPGVVVEVRKFEEGPPTGKDIRLQITGDDLAEVETVARKVRAHLDTEMKDIRDVEDSTPLPGIEWALEVDRREAGRFGTDILSVGSQIQLVTNGLLIGTYRPDDAEDEIDIRVRLPQADRTLSQLDDIRVVTKDGSVPLANFVTREARPKVSTITRRDGRYMMVVKANAANGVLGDVKVKELDAWVKQQTWPDGLEMRFRGADEEQKESGEFLGKAMLGALFLMFLILISQFDSFYQTALTLSTVVMSVFGVLLGLMLTGQTFSIIMTGTGVVALAGIVVNNAIILIDTYNHMRRDLKLPVFDSALRSAGQRLRPVLLTTITTMIGLLPMALQVNLDFFNRVIQIGSITSVWWVQLSTAIISGLGFATLLTLVLIPTLLALPATLKRRLARARLKLGLGHKRRRPIAVSMQALRQAAE